MMARRTAIGILVLATILALGALPASHPALAGPTFQGDTGNFITAMPPVAAPDLPFSDPSNALHTLSEYRGKVVLVNFWATWCVACLVEMPQLEELQHRLGGKDFAVLTISQSGGDRRQVADFLAARGLDHLPPFSDDRRQLGQAFGQTMLPTTILIDAEGREIGRLVGSAAWASPEAIEFLRRHIR